MSKLACWIWRGEELIRLRVGCLFLIPLTLAAVLPSEPPPDLRTRPAGQDWPSFLGPAATGVSAEKGLIAPWPRQGLRVVWHRVLGEGYGAPAVSRGRLYTFDRHGDKARLTCLKSETGEELWRYEYPTDYEDHFGYNNGPRSCPVVDDERVYIFGAEGMLHCVAAADGTLRWKVDTKARFNVVQNFFGVASAPVVENDLLIVPVGGSPQGTDPFPTLDQKGNGSAIVAFDKHTGQVRYQMGDELASYASPTFATIGGRRLGLHFARGGLMAFEPATGKLEFHFPWRARVLESVNASNPVVVGDRVLLTECYGPGGVLLQIREGKPAVIWSDAERPRNRSLACHWMTPIHHQGYVYASCGRHANEGDLRCVELATGKVMWTEPDMLRCSLLMADGHFVVLAEDGLLLLVKANPKKYEEVSRLDLRRRRGPDGLPSRQRPYLEYPCWAAPILANGLLYVRGKDQLICLELIRPK